MSEWVVDGGWKGREGKGREGKGREGKGREGKGREGKDEWMTSYSPLVVSC